MSSNNPFSDPSTGSNLQAQQAGKGSATAKNPFDDPNLGVEPSRSAGDYVRDAGAWGLKAALAVPETAVGLADLVTGGKVGKALENEGGSFGLRFKQAREVANDMHSDATKLAQQKFQDADGILDKTAVAVQNPSLVVGSIAESMGLMGAGGVVGRGLMAGTRLGQMGAKGAAMAGAAGEGVVGAGSAAEQIRQQTDDGLLTGKQAGLVAATGLATGAIGFAGNKVANRLGIGDADMMMAMGTKGMAKDAAERATAAAVNPLAAPAQKSILRQMGEGAIAEGVLEELPQSVSEQILQNEALGKSWSEGLDDAVVMGILSGGAMGAGAAGYRGFTDKKIRDAAKAQQDAQQAAGAAAGDSVQAAGTPWTTSAGAAGEVQPGTAPASEANAPNLDYETMPGAAAESAGNEIPFDRDFDTGGLSLQSTGPVADAPVLDNEDLRDKSGLVMPPQLDTGRIEVDTGIAPLSNETPARQWDTGNLSLVGEQQEQVAPSVRLGLNPKAGGLTKAAALAVDSGASPVVQQPQAPAVSPAEQAPVQQAAPEVPAGVDPDTGEITLQAQMEEIKSRIAYMQQQGAAQGWSKDMVAQRNALQTQLTKLEVQAGKGSKQGASTTGAPAPAALTGITQILAKQIPDMSAGELQQAIAHYGPNHKRTKKLEKALQAFAQKPLTAIESGAKSNGTQTNQAQQSGAQPAQTGAAQASAPATQSAAQGVATNATPAQHNGAQAPVAPSAKSQAASPQAAPAKQVSAAESIAKEGNAQREQERQRLVDASERWTRMTTLERQAVTESAPGLNVIARKNLHTRAWADMTEKTRAKLVQSLVNTTAGKAAQAPEAIESEAKTTPQTAVSQTAVKQKAQPMADAKPFAAETGTLGIPRSDMPQVPTANHGGLVKHLNAQGIAHETKAVDAADLKPTQAEYSPAKVEAAKSATGDRAVIVSSDGHIIDGHHQAVAAAEEGKQVKAIVLDAPVEKALEAVKASPSAQQEKSEVDESEVVDGLRVSPSMVKLGDTVKPMWKAQSVENAEREQRGERQLGGDSLHATKEQAIAAAKAQAQDAKDRVSAAVEDAEARKAEEAAAAAKKADTINGFTEGMAPNTAALAAKALNKLVRFRDKVASVREHIEAWHKAESLEVSTTQEPRIKPMSRTTFNRASQREQDAHEKRMKDAGNKTVYWVNDIDLGKTAFDYASHLLGRDDAPSEKTDAPAKSMTATPASRFEQLRDQGTGQDKGVNAFAKVAGATGEAVTTVWSRWNSVMGFLDTVKSGTGADVATKMKGQLLTEAWANEAAYPGSGRGMAASASLQAWRNRADKVAQEAVAFEREMDREELRARDAENFGVNADAVAKARAAVAEMRKRAAQIESDTKAGLEKAEIEVKLQEAAEAKAYHESFEAPSQSVMAKKPTPASITNWSNPTEIRGQNFYTNGHFVDATGTPPHLKDWQNRIGIRKDIPVSAMERVLGLAGVRNGEMDSTHVKAEPLALVNDKKQGRLFFDVGGKLVAVDLTYAQYFVSKVPGATFTANPDNLDGALRVMDGDKLAGIVMPIRMGANAPSVEDVRGYMKASGKDKPQSVVARKQAEKAKEAQPEQQTSAPLDSAPEADDFPMAEAVQSYSGISHSGRSRADGDKQAFEKFMKGAQAAGEAMAETDAQREALAAAVEQLRADYLQQYRALMNVRAATYSGFVAGRGNLNSKQANARNNALDKAMERFDGWVGDNVDRVSGAVLAARTPEQVKADRDAKAAKIQEKADKKAASLKATLLKFLGFKSGDNMPYGKSAIITKVSYDRDGYPSSLTFKMADGSPVTDDKLDLVPTLKEKDETLEQAKARIRSLVDELRAENPELTKGAGAIRTAAGKTAKPKSVPAKMREAIAARADYFSAGNIVKGYGGHDRVISYQPPGVDGRWTVTVQAVEKKGDTWVDVSNEGQRTHATQPDARELKAGPVERAPQQESASQETREAAPASFLDRHNAIEEGISAGTLALEDYKSAFADLEANEAAVLGELKKLTKEQLLRAGGSMFAYRMKDDKKDAIVLAAYRKMLDTYALGRNYGPSSYFLSAASLAKNKADKAQALRELVSATTAEDLAARAAEIKAARDEVKARHEAQADALANPKSLQDFRGFMRHWMDRGETMNQAYLRLSPEQRQQYDALEAQQSKEAREAAKRRAQVSVASAGNTTAGEVIATKHTKHGHDLFVVKLADRVERDAYDTLNSSAKRLGGSYSSYRGNGAVPGFQFRTRDAAEAFQKLVAGDTAQAQELANQRRDAFDDDKSQSAAERLRTMADALDERATEVLGAERKVNTARRARFAASADAAARSQQALAGTMRNIAQAIDAGTTQFLDGVRQRVQVEYLMGQLRTAKSNQLQAKYPDYGERMKRQGEPMDAETVDFATFPTYEMYRSDWASLARQLLALDGGKKLGATLARHADDVTEAYTDWAKENLLRVSHFGNKLQGGFAEFASKDDAERAIKRSGLAGKAVVLPIKRGQNRVILSPSEAMQQGLWQGDGDKRMSIGAEFIEDLMKLGKRKGSKALALPWQLESAYENRQRLQRMGILTRAEFRSALRELASLQQEMATPDRIKELERSMVGRANDGLDFFPTSPAVVQSMLDAAEIAEGMAVLEPSAGMGHIADAIVAESGVWPDVVELSGDRRELLEAKGFHLAEVNDFLNMEPRRFFTYGDTFRAPDGVEGIMRGVGGMGSQRVRLEDADGNRISGYYDRSELVPVAQNGSWSGYDRIIMNPPFSDGRDIQHVLHAYSLLRPGGRIVAIMGEGAFFQSNKRAEAFRDWLDERGATNEKLPDGSFMDPSLPVNTGVAARMVVIDKPEGDHQLAPRDEDTTANYAGNAKRRPASAQDKAVMQAIADGKSARDVLRLIASGSKDPFLRQTARLLLKAGITPNIEFGHIGLHKGNPIHGQYRGKTDTIAIAGSAEYAAERIFMHEAMHAATMRALAKPGLAKLQLQKLAAHVRKQPGAAGFYGISDKEGRVDEFVAEVFTNPDFQAALRKMSAPAGGTIKTAWDGFVRILRSILGLPNDSTNALSQALNLGVAAMREDMALRQQGARSSRSAEMTEASSERQKARVLQGAPVAELDTSIAPIGAPAIRAWASKLFAQQGGFAHSPAIGQVVIDERAVRSSIAHGRPNAYKVAAFAAVKDVLEKGALVLSARHGRDGESFYVSAPVKLDGAVNIVTVLVKRDPNDQRMYLHSVATKENLLNRQVSRTDTTSGVERSGSNDSGDATTVATQGAIGKASPEAVADELNRLLRLDVNDQGDVLNFGADDFTKLKSSALDQIHKTLSHPGKVSLWDKSVGTMRHLAERAPAFKPVYEAASQNIDDVSMLANDAADMAPRILPRVESWADLKKKPVSAADNKAIAKPLFEGTLLWARDENGNAVLVDDLQKRYANLSAHNKAAMLLKHGKIDAGVLAMWQGLPAEQFEKLINSRFESKLLKPGIVWSDAELKSQFGATDNQISLYRETRAAIDRSIDMTARTDMLRVVGDKYEAMREAVLAQPTVEAAAQLLLDTLEQDAKADPDSADRLGLYMQQIKSRMETAADLQKAGYAPLTRFGRYTVDVVDANGERQYFGMYESKRESNLAAMQLAQEFKGATITKGTMSAEAYKLFAGVTPETLEQFGEMLGLKAEGNEAQDKAFQEFLKLTKNNHSAMKRLIHRKGTAGFSEDVGRVIANFVYSNARAGAMGLNAGKMDKAINEIPKEQGELKDLAMGLRSYIRDPQEEGQAVRGMLFAQYLGGSIASAFVNTTQPFAVTLPWLSQYGGMKKAGAQLARALKDMATKGHQYEADLAKALQSAEDDGVVSPQEIHQLMAQARGAGMLRSGDGTKAGDLRANLGNKWEQTKVLWGQPFALAEQFNRRSTFIAAYRTAKEQGIANPAEFARQAVLETQFVYTKANKPRWARGAVGGTLFTFKTYSVSYLELMQRMWTQGGPEGKRAVGWALAMLVLMSGAGGVPFMEDAEDLIDGAGQLMGYNISAKQWRKELLASVVGAELGEFMEQGLSGLPGAPIDVSGRLGMGNLIPGTGLFLNKPNRERDLMEMVGPAGDLVARGFTGARKLLGGDVAGAALEVSPTAVRNLAKGADMAATGMYRDTKGYKVIDTTLAEAAAKAIGFQPKTVAEVQEANSFMQRSKSFYIQTSSEIKAQWADALFRKDEAALERVRERLADWNRDNPEQPIVVKMPDVWKRVREMGKDRSDRIADTAPKALREQMREQVRSLS